MAKYQKRNYLENWKYQDFTLLIDFSDQNNDTFNIKHFFSFLSYYIQHIGNFFSIIILKQSGQKNYITKNDVLLPL